MDLGRLRTLRELSNRQTMTAVANALGLTPSAVSQQIAMLEEEAGLALTVRRGRGVELTNAGEVLVAHADRVMNVIDEARSDLATLRSEVSGNLRVAAFATAAAVMLPPLVQRLRHAFPRLHIRVTEMEPSEGLAALKAWEADLAVVDGPSVQLARMERAVVKVPLIDDELHAIVATDHPLAGRDSIALSELSGEPWALDSATSFYGKFVLDLCRQAGYVPWVNAACRGPEIIAAMVASGCSVSVVPGLRLGQIRQQVAARPLRPAVKRHICLAYRLGERSHPAVQVFVHQLLCLMREGSVAGASPGDRAGDETGPFQTA